MVKTFAWSPLRRLMKKTGVTEVNRNAIDKLIEYLESSSEAITSKALENAKHEGRKKLTVEDIKIAMDLI